MTDRTFPGESRAQDEARQGEAESVAKEGLAGGDGAVIGASESSDWRLGQVSSRGGCAYQPLKARMAGIGSKVKLKEQTVSTS
ncbi:hypothetical protein A6R68_15289 [Neotoma lepida]|uniref:Uncharacterized protein n=1 Tax=Neotoma lepida TaxID=56216 RepID=A0A1A6H6E1_NEOLE|nr:hypothetical protein A6R68_15289 [Neotoma lepida]